MQKKEKKTGLHEIGKEDNQNYSTDHLSTTNQENTTLLKTSRGVWALPPFLKKKMYVLLREGHLFLWLFSGIFISLPALAWKKWNNENKIQIK